jgi:hypothetical protein
MVVVTRWLSLSAKNSAYANGRREDVQGLAAAPLDGLARSARSNDSALRASTDSRAVLAPRTRGCAARQTRSLRSLERLAASRLEGLARCARSTDSRLRGSTGCSPLSLLPRLAATRLKDVMPHSLTRPIIAIGSRRRGRRVRRAAQPRVSIERPEFLKRPRDASIERAERASPSRRAAPRPSSRESGESVAAWSAASVKPRSGASIERAKRASPSRRSAAPVEPRERESVEHAKRASPSRREAPSPSSRGAASPLSEQSERVRPGGAPSPSSREAARPSIVASP